MPTTLTLYINNNTPMHHPQMPTTVDIVRLAVMCLVADKSPTIYTRSTQFDTIPSLLHITKPPYKTQSKISYKQLLQSIHLNTNTQ
jgi:hypothetical protein